MSRFARSGTRSSAAIGASATARAYRRGRSLETTRDGLRRACARCARAGTALQAVPTLAHSGARPRLDRGGGPGGRRARAGSASRPGVDRRRPSPRLRHGQPDRAARRLVPRAGHGRRRGRGRAESRSGAGSHVCSPSAVGSWDGPSVRTGSTPSPVGSSSRSTPARGRRAAATSCGGDWPASSARQPSRRCRSSSSGRGERRSRVASRCATRPAPCGSQSCGLPATATASRDWLGARRSSDHRPHGAAGDCEHRPRGTGGRDRPRHRSAVNELEPRALGEQLQLP